MSTSLGISVDQYDEMIARGVFEPEEDHRVELLEGLIVVMSPIGEGHEDALDRLAEWSIRNGPIDEIRVRVQNSLGILELQSVPQPDLAWVRRRSYGKRRPQVADLRLLVEVAHSSLRNDRKRKSRIYASAGVTDYWIVNVPGRCIEVRRQPQGSIFQSIRTYSPGESIPLLAFPALALPVAVVFPDDDDDDDDDAND